MICTAIVKNGTLYVQAAAGVVADSIPEMEWKETVNTSAPRCARLNWWRIIK